jgi:hypothetical protein
MGALIQQTRVKAGGKARMQARDKLAILLH